MRLYKDSKNKMLGGVCAGIADAINTDVTLVRVAMVFANLMFNAFIPVYFILLVILPEKGNSPDTGLGEGIRSLLRSFRAHEERRNIASWLLPALLIAAGLFFTEKFLHIDIKWKYLLIIGTLLYGLYLITTRDLHNNPSKIIITGVFLCILAILWLASSSGFLYFPVAIIVSAVVNMWPVCLAALGVSLLLHERRHVAFLWGVVAFIVVALTIINYISIMFL